MKTATTMFFLFLAIPAPAQDPVPVHDTRPGAASGDPTIVISPEQDYRIAPGDVVDVTVLDAGELSREYRVDAGGTIEVPFLGRVEASGKTTGELASAIAGGLRGNYLVNPQVSVLSSQINRRYFVQGAVRQPGVYNIEGTPTLLELISIAGGLSGSYGGTAFIIRKLGPAERKLGAAETAALPAPQPDPGLVEAGFTAAEAPDPGYALEKASIHALLRGEFSQNLAIRPGDIVHIPQADVFFVAGAVNAPGSFPLAEGTTVRQAVSLAQGTTRTASAGNAVIYREEDGVKVEIPVDVGEVMDGKADDVAIRANDIIVVPTSGLKSAFFPVVNAFGTAAALATGQGIIR